MKRLIFLLLLCLALPSVQAQPGKRGYVGGKYALELDGKFIGWLQSVEGGVAAADVVSDKAGSGQAPRKRLGAVRYEPLVLTLPLETLPGLLDWVGATQKGSPARHSGAVLFADFNYKVSRRLEFQQALLTEFTLPTIDATAAREPAYFRVTLAAESTRFVDGKDSKVTGTIGTKQRWVANNFRLTIPGLDCAGVSKIEGLSFQLKTSTEPVGARRELNIVPTLQSYSDPEVTVSVAKSSSFETWFQDFVIKGNSTDSQEKEGKLELLSQNLTETLFTINLHHIGIARYELSEDTGQIPKVFLKLYVESMDFLSNLK